jgi:diguanylate cyclase (GGDEF)-like protein/PAS domain S-box-containing protein
MRIIAELKDRIHTLLGLKRFDEKQFGGQAAREVRQIQTQSVYSLTSAMMYGNILFATLLTANLLGYGFWPTFFAVSWCAIVVSLSLFTLKKSKSRKKLNKKHSGSEQSIKNLIISSAILSSVWCVPVVMFYSFTDGVERGVITAIMAGILSAGAASLSRVPKAAYTWLFIAGTIHFVVALYAGISTGRFADITIAIFAILATAGLASSVYERSASFFKAFENTQKIKEKSEVIDLLLKDYESQATEWLWETDEQGYGTRAPQQVLDMLGFDMETFTGTTAPQLARMHTTEESSENLSRLMDALSRREEFHDITLSIKDVRDGSTKWIMTRGKPQWDEDKFLGYRGICADATAAMEAEKNIHYLARHDTLTGLSNRPTFNDQLNLWHNTDRSYGILLIDLDHFKAVNDTMGHAAGDYILKQVAKRLKEATGEANLRRSDECTIARLGGDEFAITFAEDRRNPGSNMNERSKMLSKRIVELMSQPFTFEGKEIRIGASVGYVIAPEDGDEVTRLINRADMALYRAKANGKSTQHRFDYTMDEETRSAKLLELDVCNALQLGQLKIAYQPIVSVGFGQDDTKTLKPMTAGMEALLRWEHPTKGNISPDEFIPIAEATGSIISIGEWVLKQACLEAASWDEEHTIAVNVSVKQIIAPNFIHTVLGALATSGLPANRLEIEMTESVLITDPELTIATIKQLRSLGVRVSLDDFGTGYSSLSYIADFDVDRIKIDKSFVEKLSDKNANAAPVISAITNLASSLGLVTVGEGVETQEQADLLKKLGCDHLQGYFYGKPVIRDVHDCELPDNLETLDDKRPDDSKGEDKNLAKSA